MAVIGAGVKGTMARQGVAALAFVMAFLMTPRVMVEPKPDRDASIPVNALDSGGECLWCEPSDPSQCDRLDAQAPLWLNPDSPPPSSPCDPLEQPTPPTPSSGASPQA